MSSGRFTGTADNGRYLYIDWSNSGTSFTAKLYLMGDLTGIANTGSHFTVDGTQYAISGTFDNWGTGTPLLLKTVNITTSKSSIVMSGAFIYNGGSWTAVYISGTATLGTAPDTPTNVTASGIFALDSPMTISWTAVAGATSYKLYYWQKTTSGNWAGPTYLKDVATTSTTYTFTLLGEDRTDVKFGVSAVNSVGESSIAESNVIARSFIKVWNGSAYINGKATVWDGSAWKPATIKIWDGTSWTISK